MANKMLVLFQISLDEDTKLHRVLWLYHHDAEAVEVLKILLDKIYAAEATKNVVDWQKARHVKLELGIQLH